MGNKTTLNSMYYGYIVYTNEIGEKVIDRRLSEWIDRINTESEKEIIFELNPFNI